MVDIDQDEHRHLVLVFDSGHRTTVSCAHAEGVELLQKLTEYYGRLEYGHGTDEVPTKEGLLVRLVKKFLTPKS